jgi:hypothetical protein
MKISAPRPPREQRGLALILVLFVVVALLLIAVAVLTNSSFTANDALSVGTKMQTFDAAEAGLNVAQWQIDQNQGAASGSTGTGTVNGYTYTWEIVSNQLHSSGATVSDPNPHQSANISVPAGQALLAGSASSVLGGRTVYVEAMVVPAPPTYLPDGAIICGKTGQISHQQITDTSGSHHADVRCGTLTSSGGGQVPDGDSYAVSNSNAIVGYDGIAHVNAPPPTFLTAAQLAGIQSSALAQAQSGGVNFYASGNVSGGSIGSNGSNCVAYIAGNLTLGGNGSVTNYCPTTVVMGNVNVGGNADYQALPASTAHIMYVFGSGGTVLHGTPTTVGIVYVANADVTINGGGHGNFTGSVITPNNVTMNGGGTASFDYNSTQTPPPVPNPNVIPESQWDY